MKKLFTVLLAASALSGFAQKNGVTFSTDRIRPIGNAFADKTDSLLLPGFITGSDTSCLGLSLYTFNIQGQAAGFVTGFNAYFDAEKGQVFQGVPGAKVTSTLAFVGVKADLTPAGASDTYVSKLYSIGADTSVTLLGTSVPVAFADIDTTFTQGIPNPTVFAFAAPVSVPATFLVTFEVIKIVDDTTINSGIAIYSSPSGCGEGAFEIWSDGTPSYMSAAWNNLHIDLFAGVNQQFTASIAENNLTTFNVFPNPAAETANFAYTLKESAKVNIQIVNVAGQTVMTLNEGTKAAGSYNSSVDVSTLSNGVYFYNVNVNGTASKGKFVVSK